MTDHDDSEYTYVCMAMNSWGKASTLKGAVANCRKAFGRGMNTYLVRRYPAASNPVVDPIDGRVEYANGYGCSHLVKAVRNGLNLKEYNGVTLPPELPTPRKPRRKT